MPTRNVNLTEHYDRFVEAQVASGRFESASEVMRAGLRLLEQYTDEERHKLGLLKRLAAEAFSDLDQGRGIELEGRSDLRKLIAGTGRRVGRSKRG